MSTITNLTDCYTHELKDSWSANDQMTKVVRELADKASDDSLKQRLTKSADGIEKHTSTIKELLDDCGVSEKEHCKGMEGLVKEARKHAIEGEFESGEVRDVVIIAQFQRMCHYGIAGFGTAKAFAEGLGNDAHAAKLDKITAEIYDTDENLSDLAERCSNLRAAEG